MKGLLLKDFFLFIKNIKFYVFALGFFFVLSFLYNDSGFISGMVVLYFTLFAVSSFSYDDLAGFDIYARSLPVTRKEIVASKYLLGLILSFSGGVLSIVFGLIFNVLKGKSGILKQLLVSYTVICIGLFFLCLILPLIYKFGTEKSRYLMFIIFLIPTLLFVGLSKMNAGHSLAEILPLLLKLSPAILVVFLVLSFLASCNIYERKE
ncbi:MAG: ABC-2 transporter permease [Bacillota bacterium]|nr:ABC-2 transporter permease [Bacillota bacterium]